MTVSSVVRISVPILLSLWLPKSLKIKALQIIRIVCNLQNNLVQMLMHVRRRMPQSSLFVHSDIPNYLGYVAAFIPTSLKLKLQANAILLNSYVLRRNNRMTYHTTQV